tara:strand:+ start:4972 stop:7047 length:2076 start_codon:yes stop_codon:yes gene_type:complete
MSGAKEAAEGRWPELLRDLAGLTDGQLKDEHGPCPLCGGKDRYRFDDKDGKGTYFCNQCGAGDGFALLMKKNGWTFREAAKAVERKLGLEADRAAGPNTASQGTNHPVFWQYTESFRVKRQDLPGGRKRVRPETFVDGRWVEKGPAKGTIRPLLYECRIAENPEATVLVVEGEKTCDAAQKLFPNGVVCTTWSGGAINSHLTSWQALSGRKVVLWPDNDNEGNKGMRKVASLLSALERPPVSIRYAKNPQDAPPKWDVADSGWTPEQAAAFVRANLTDQAPDIEEDQQSLPVAQAAPVKQQREETVPLKHELVKPKPHELLALLRAPNDLRFNVFTQQVERGEQVITGVERTYLEMAERGLQVDKQLAIDAIVHVAHENPYDPVRLYLEHVEAEVAPAYIDRLASTYLRPQDQGLPDPTLYDVMLRKTLIGAVRRCFEPGCKHDTATVLMGEQGCRKSSFWKALGGPFFSDALKDVGSKDDYQVMAKSWIMEWAELDSITGKRHAGQIKAFLSQAVDCYRVPYGKTAENFPRRGIIVGSTNRQTGFLVDETGNRRFWVIPTPKTEADPIDINGLELERDAIWAAAMKLYRQGEENFLSITDSLKVTKENDDYLIANPWTETIVNWLNLETTKGEIITTERILTSAVLKPVERQTRADQMAVSDILKGLGFTRRRLRENGERIWQWFPPQAS